MKIPRIIIAATHSGTGKTTITSGIILSLRKRGLIVQPYKVGPDYIDPGFHTLAAGRTCRNLDTVMMGEEGVTASFRSASKDADIAVIEGVMGLYDGFSGGGPRTGPASRGAAADVPRFFGSTAHIAKVLRAPVVLCIDASAMSSSAAAVALGFQQLDPDVPLAGFILNNIAGARHYEMIKKPVEDATGLSVFGYVPKNAEITLPERHLGLVPAWERKGLFESSKVLERAVSKNIDIEKLVTTARNAYDLPPAKAENDNIFQPREKFSKTKRVKIGYALDDAFHFYYRDNLEILASFGAELFPFSPIEDTKLPPGIRGVYIGGGYPEMFGRQLEKNTAMRKTFRQAAAGGLPVYAECGGLMYLMDRIVDFDGSEYEMCGVFTGAVMMEKKLAALGYYFGRAEEDSSIAKRGDGIWGHVFHWSTLRGLAEQQPFAFSLDKPGKRPVRDGLMFKNVLAGYFHIHFAGNPAWAQRFVEKCSQTAAEIRE